MLDNVVDNILFSKIFYFFFMIIKIMNFDLVDCFFNDPDPCWIDGLLILDVFTYALDDNEIYDTIEDITDWEC